MILPNYLAGYKYLEKVNNMSKIHKISLDEFEEKYEDYEGKDCLIIYGSSDDLIEFRGSIEEEIGAYKANHIIDIDNNTQLQITFGKNDCGWDIKIIKDENDIVELYQLIEDDGENIDWCAKINKHVDIIKITDASGKGNNIQLINRSNKKIELTGVYAEINDLLQSLQYDDELDDDDKEKIYQAICYIQQKNQA
jgi:hypothetical protein